MIIEKRLTVSRYEKGQNFSMECVLKGYLFHQVVYERVRGWTMGWNLRQAGMSVESKIASNGDE